MIPLTRPEMDKQQRILMKAYAQCGEGIFRHCYFRVSNIEKAKDLAQETFAKAWSFMAGGHIIKNMKSYLYKIARNLIIDYYRKKKEVSLDALQEDGFDPGFDTQDHLENFIDGKEAVSMIQRLEGSHRGVVTMRYIDDMSIQDIAVILGISENVVSVRLHRALRKMRKMFADMDLRPKNVLN